MVGKLAGGSVHQIAAWMIIVCEKNLLSKADGRQEDLAGDSLAFGIIEFINQLRYLTTKPIKALHPRQPRTFKPLLSVSVSHYIIEPMCIIHLNHTLI
jgi:hypothetical protein